MNDNLSDEKICCTVGCGKPARRTGKYCLSCRIKLSHWLTKATRKVCHYEQLNFYPGKVWINPGGLYNEDIKTESRDFEPSE